MEHSRLLADFFRVLQDSLDIVIVQVRLSVVQRNDAIEWPFKAEIERVDINLIGKMYARLVRQVTARIKLLDAKIV